MAAAGNGCRRRETIKTREIPSRYMSSCSSTSSSSSSCSSSGKGRNGFDRRRRWSGSVVGFDDSDTESVISFVGSVIDTPIRCMTEGRRRFPLPKSLNSKDFGRRTASAGLISCKRLNGETEKKSWRIGKVQSPLQCRGSGSVERKTESFRRGKGGDQRSCDTLLLKFMYNQQMQWRFVNARAGVHMNDKKMEKDLLKVWTGISQLLHSVTTKRKKLQYSIQNLKLDYMLKSQVQFLEEVESLGKDLTTSLVGTIEATQAATISLPTVRGAKACIQPLKDALYSAVDVLSAVVSSTHPFISKQVEEMEGLIKEMNYISRKESFLTYKCRHLFPSYSPMEAMKESLAAHLLQVKGRPASPTLH